MTILTVTPDIALHIEIQDFYARQSRALDSLDIDAFAEFFTDDGVMTHAHRNQSLSGKASLIENSRRLLPTFEGRQVRHWFHQFVVDSFVDPVDGPRIEVSYYTLVSSVDRDGTISFEPTFLAEDRLVRVGGELKVKSRIIYRDQPA